MINPEITCTVLNGGQSRRFGSPKFLARIGGLTLLERAIILAGSIGAETILAGTQPTDSLPLNLKIVPDYLLNSGPAAGIAAALGYIKTEWLAVIPVDMPFLNKLIYQELFNQKLDALIIAARSRSGLEPLVSIWNRQIHQTLQTWLRDGGRSLHHFFYSDFPEQKFREIEFLADTFYQPVECFTNINYSADLLRVESSPRG